MIDEPKVQPQTFGWSLSQRRALVVLLGIVVACLGVQLLIRRTYIGDPQPPHGARYDELASRIDPNQADWQTLAAIPGLGEKRARAIVAYRQRLHHSNPAAPAFRDAADLAGVRGIGPAMVENLRPYLTFSLTRHDALPPPRVDNGWK